VVLEDAASGMSQIHAAEIKPDIWTLSGSSCRLHNTQYRPLDRAFFIHSHPIGILIRPRKKVVGMAL
jgi:hypothetical protein